MQGYGYAPQQRQEQQLFAAGGVQVTTARLVCWNQTYPMASISSVSTFIVPASQSGFGWAVFFGLGALGSFAMAALGIAVSSTEMALVFGLLTACSTTFAILISRAVRARKPSYGVMISTAGMQVRAVVSPDGPMVQAIVGALNHALSMR